MKRELKYSVDLRESAGMTVDDLKRFIEDAADISLAGWRRPQVEVSPVKAGAKVGKIKSISVTG